MSPSCCTLMECCNQTRKMLNAVFQDRVFLGSHGVFKESCCKLMPALRIPTWSQHTQAETKTIATQHALSEPIFHKNTEVTQYQSSNIKVHQPLSYSGSCLDMTVWKLSYYCQRPMMTRIHAMIVGFALSHVQHCVRNRMAAKANVWFI